MVAQEDHSRNLNEDDIEVRDQSMADFLAKPQLLNTTTFTTGNADDDLIYSVDVATALLANSYWTNKMQGFNLVRGTAVLRVQINANPFQQGKLLISFLPNEAPITSSGDSSYAAMHTTTMAGLRQLPCVELDLRQSVAILKIPWCAPTNWYNIKHPDFTWGKFRINVLAQMRTGSAGETSISVFSYLHFEDFEFAAPSIPQAGGKSKGKFATKTFTKSQEAAEATAAGATPVADAFRLVSKASNTLSGIPILSSVMRPLSWVTGYASRIASSLGWAKPRLADAPLAVTRQYNRYLPNSDGIDTGIKLALTSDNAICISDKYSLTDQDEMSFEFLKRVSTVINRTNWSTGDAVGTSLYSILPDPLQVCGVYSKTIGAHTVTYAQGPPIFYLAGLFNNWRGSLRYTLKIAKTDFHRGRIMITWTPTQGNSVTAPVATGNAVLALRHIVDIQEGAEITLDLPYLQAYNYLPTGLASGQLDVTVLNALRCPETCNSSIELIHYFSGGPDFEFAVPAAGTMYANPAYVAPFSPQVGVLDATSIGNGQVQSENNFYVAESIGEKFTSVKQLLSRASKFYRGSSGNESAFTLWPWFRSVLSMTAVTGVLAQPTLGGDLYNMITQMYVWNRGSIRITVGTDSTAPMYVANTIFEGGGLNAFASSGLLLDSNATGSFSTNVNLVSGTAISVQEGLGIMSMELPYYSLAGASTNYNSLPASSTSPYDKSMCLSQLTFQQASATKANIFRSTGDNFQVSYFIGAPPLYITTT
jgi:hypothetical protein